MKNNSDLVVTSPNNTAWSPKALAGNYKDDIEWKSEMISDLKTGAKWRLVADHASHPATTNFE